MKKILSILLFFPLFMSCKTNEEKIQDLIREQMFQTLYDYQSYEPIQTTDIMEEIHSLNNDVKIVSLGKTYTEGNKKLEYKSDKYYDDIAEIFHETLDSRSKVLILSNELDQPYGFSVIHKFRAKNKGGIYNIYTKKYLIDKDLKNIIWEYTIEGEDKVKTDIAYFINRWNDSKLWKQENINYLEENKKKDSVITTESGLQYKIIKQGKGSIPSKTSNVKVHYIGKLINGQEFDSSYKRGTSATFRADMVIKGWTEALTLMPVGSKWEIYIPYELGYGSRRNDKIKPYSTLIFEIDLLGVE